MSFAVRAAVIALTAHLKTARNLDLIFMLGMMSLMVSRFCILLSRNVLFNYLSLTLPVHSAMGKVWFIVGLVASRYYIAIDATNIIGFSLLFAALFSLTGGYMEPDPTPLPRRRLKLFR